MSVAAATADSIQFGHSNSQVVGVKHDVKQYMSKHADHLSGRSSLAGDGLFTASAFLSPDPAVALATAGAMVASRLPLALADHDRASQDEMTYVGHRPKNWVERVQKGASKAIHPIKNPVESAAALSLLAGIFFIVTGGSGLIGLLNDPTLASEAIGITGEVAISVMNLLLGGVMVATRSMEIFGDTPKEREAWAKQEAEEQGVTDSLTFAKSEHQQLGTKGQKQGLFQHMEDNPEIMSGLVGMAGSALMIGIGTLKTMSGSPDGLLYAVSGIVYLASTLIYTLFVRRDHEQDVTTEEVHRDEQHTQTEPMPRHQAGRFTERLAAEEIAPESSPQRS